MLSTVHLLTDEHGLLVIESLAWLTGSSR